MKSIWDVRFTKKKLAMDAAVKNAFVALDEWLTVHPNGPDNVGRHIELDGEGRIINGMGGSHNGEKLSQIGIKSAFPKEYHGEETNPDNINNLHFMERVWGYKHEIDKNKPPIDLSKYNQTNPAVQKPSYVKDPNAPKSLNDTAAMKKYFNDKAQDIDKQIKELPVETPNREEKIKSLERLKDGYERNAGWVRENGRGSLAKKLEESDYPVEMRQTTAKNWANWAYEAARKEPTGVGYWQAHDIYKEVEPYLSNEGKSKLLANGYEDLINGKIPK